MTTVLNDVSVIVTVKNEAQSIETLMAALTNQTLDPAEIIIVDAGSTDGTFEWLQAWATTSRIPMQLLSAPGASISAGRNVGIRTSQSCYVAVTDAGTSLPANWLCALRASAGPNILAGTLWHPRAENRFADILGAALLPLRSEVLERTFLPSSRSAIFPRAAWIAVGGYPEWLDYCEDLVFDISLKRYGCQVRLIEDASVGWNARSSFVAYAKQYFRYARGDRRAGLWRLRHIARYAFYVTCVPLLINYRSPKSAFVLGLLWMSNGRRFFIRIFRRYSDDPRNMIIALLLLLPIVLVGDLSKMAGYAVGARVRLTDSEK